MNAPRRHDPDAPNHTYGKPFEDPPSGTETRQMTPSESWPPSQATVQRTPQDSQNPTPEDSQGRTSREAGSGAAGSMDSTQADSRGVERPHAPALAPGIVILGKYKILGMLGSGGFGEVWKAEHTETQGLRALKIISSRHMQDDPLLLQRFRNEARLMERLNHKNAVAIKEFERFGDSLCLVMEYVNGVTLREEMGEKRKGQRDERRHQPLPLGKVFRILRQICDVLQATHDQSIVHRDLKPENIMLVATGKPRGEEVKVLDFGIAKVVNKAPDAEQSTLDGTMTKGNMVPPCTPAYASPEQVRSKDIDPRSDLYSLGLILFEMLTGRLPFPAEVYPTQMQMLLARCQDAPMTFAEANPEVSYPPGVVAVVMKCLELNPNDRHASATALYTAFLEAVRPYVPEEELTGYSTNLPPVPPPTPVPEVSTWRPWVVRAMAGLVLLPLSYLAVISFWPPPKPVPIPVPPPADPHRDILALISERGYAVGDGAWPGSQTWPPAVYPISDAEAGYTRIHVSGSDDVEGHYIPDLYRVRAAEGGEPELAADGWPAAIERVPRDGSVSDMVLRRVPGGVFQMGNDENGPRHQVALDGFYMHETEATEAQLLAHYESVGYPRNQYPTLFNEYVNMLDRNPTPPTAERSRPAVGLSWHDARKFAEAQRALLPTEAQWEYAARSGGEEGIEHVWEIHEQAPRRFGENDVRQAGLDRLSEGDDLVRSYPLDCTRQEIYDLNGNVREWCRDSYAAEYLNIEPAAVNPLNEVAGQPHVVRGGSWQLYDVESTVFHRDSGVFGDGGVSAPDVGFRIVVEPLTFRRGAP